MRFWLLFRCLLLILLVFLWLLLLLLKWSRFLFIFRFWFYFLLRCKFTKCWILYFFSYFLFWWTLFLKIFFRWSGFRLFLLVRLPFLNFLFWFKLRKRIRFIFWRTLLRRLWLFFILILSCIFILRRWCLKICSFDLHMAFISFINSIGFLFCIFFQIFRFPFEFIERIYLKKLYTIFRERGKHYWP